MNNEITDRPDPDIVDYAFFTDPPGLIDLSGAKSTLALPIPIFIPELKETRGKRELTPFEAHYRDVLSVCAVRAMYGLEALGFTPSKARDMVGAKLTTVSIDKTIRLGRAACTRITSFQSPQAMEAWAKKKFEQMPHLAGADAIKEEAIGFELYDIPILDRTYSRAREVLMGLYNAERVKKAEKKHQHRVNSIVYRKNIPAPTLVECIAISCWTYTNVSWLWPSFWYYRFIFEAVAALGHLHQGRHADLTAMDAYVLFKMCEDDCPDNTGHDRAKQVIRHFIELPYGRAKFLAESMVVLHNLGLLEPRPKTTLELIERVGHLGRQPVMRLHSNILIPPA